MERMTTLTAGKAAALESIEWLWSGPITGQNLDNEHRLVYQVFDDKIRLLACRYHY